MKFVTETLNCQTEGTKIKYVKIFRHKYVKIQVFEQ
jgi:hypothetical protein